MKIAEPKFIAEMKHTWQRGVSFAHRLDEQSRGWLSVAGSALKETLKPKSVISAAAISYFTLFSIFPMLLLSISIASFNLSLSSGWRLIISMFEFVAPALDDLIGQNVGRIIQMRGPVTGIALLSLVWSASAVFYTLTQTMHDIWGHQRRRAAWKRRGLAILVVLAIVGPILFLASFASSLIDNARTWLPEEILFIGRGLSFFVAALLDIALLMILYLLLPHGNSTWREILPGATAAGLLWELAKKAFLLFVSSYVSATNLVYGSVAAIIALLTWAYVSGLVFLFGANISRSFQYLKQNRQKSLVSDPPNM